MPEYVYNAGSPRILLDLIAEDTRVKHHFRPYGQYGDRYRRDLRPTFLKLLRVFTGGDVFGFLNDILSPLDVAQHIQPANKVAICIRIVCA